MLDGFYLVLLASKHQPEQLSHASGLSNEQTAAAILVSSILSPFKY